MTYPPPNHYLSDLGGRLTIAGDTSHVFLDLEPTACAPGGTVLLGVLATAIDMAAGSLSGRRAAPDWVATSDIAIDLVEPLPAGPCRVDCRLGRRGRGLITLDLELRRGHDDHARRSGVATAAFAVLPDPGRVQGGRRVAAQGTAREEGREDGDPAAAFAQAAGQVAPSSDGPLVHRPAHSAGGPRATLPLHERIGIRVADAGAGVVEAQLVDYVRNTFGALQGGVVAVLAEAAMLAATGGTLTALAVRYRTLGRVGPFRTSVDLVEGAWGQVVRAAIRDAGAGDVVVAVGTGRLAPG